MPFPEKGGPGYDPNQPPNPKCPECWGDGKSRPVIHDTRELEDGEAMMYAGIKITKDSVDVRMHSPFEALQLIGRHLGMWNDKLDRKVTPNPLLTLPRWKAPGVADASGEPAAARGDPARLCR